MKKLVSIFVVIVMICTMSVSTFAAEINVSEKAILDTLKSISVNGMQIDAADLTAAENYFLRDDVNLTEAQKTAIITDINQAVTLVEQSGVQSLSDLPTATKTQILDLAKNAGSEVGLSLTYNPGTKTATFTDSSGTTVYIAEDIIKNTGGIDFSVALIVLGAFLLLTVFSVIAARKSKLFQR